MVKFKTHSYLYCAIFTQDGETENSFVDGIYETKKKILTKEDLMNLKSYIEEDHGIKIKNFNFMSVVTLTYLGIVLA